MLPMICAIISSAPLMYSLATVRPGSLGYRKPPQRMISGSSIFQQVVHIEFQAKEARHTQRHHCNSQLLKLSVSDFFTGSCYFTGTLQANGKRFLKAEAPEGSFMGSPIARAEMATEVNTTLSWEGLAEILGNSASGYVERLAHAKDRVFGPGDPTAVIFYRDNSSWCPYCERVWLQLEEKRISYRVEKVNMRCYGEKPEWYTRMVPSGLLPAVKLNGKLLTESLDIMMAIEEAFPKHNPLLPSVGSPERAAVTGLLNLERVLMGAWLTRLKSSWGDLNAFNSTMDKVDASLQRFGGPYFLGKQFTLIDAVYAPFLERIAASVPYWPGILVRGEKRWSAVNAWFDAMDTRPTYQAIKSDDFSITHNLEPQIGKCKSLPAGAEYRAKINGQDGGWELPLKPEETAWGKDNGSGGDGAKEEAARALIKNHSSIVGFALRGVVDGEKHRDVVDLGFRYVAFALLVGHNNIEDLPKLSKEVAVAAAYLRDRIGVPRDLTYPAARQLRGHLHWLVKQSGVKVEASHN